MSKIVLVIDTPNELVHFWNDYKLRDDRYRIGMFVNDIINIAETVSFDAENFLMKDLITEVIGNLMRENKIEVLHSSSESIEFFEKCSILIHKLIFLFMDTMAKNDALGYSKFVSDVNETQITIELEQMNKESGEMKNEHAIKQNI